MSSEVFSSTLRYAFPKSAPYAGAVDYCDSLAEKQIQLLLKRGVDFLLALFGLMMLSPFLLLLAGLVLLSSPGPVFYKSRRVGQGKKIFYMYKFRSMVSGADRLRSKLQQKNNLQGRLFKLKDDRRVTKIGRIMRKYSLDEFPQLLNVLKGEMSLVGPRPYVEDESEMFKPPYTVRFQTLPGITGPWQVNGRSDLQFEELCQLEYDYVTHWNLFTDIALLLKTIPSVLFKRGAY